MDVFPICRERERGGGVPKFRKGAKPALLIYISYQHSQ